MNIYEIDYYYILNKDNLINSILIKDELINLQIDFNDNNNILNLIKSYLKTVDSDTKFNNLGVLFKLLKEYETCKNYFYKCNKFRFINYILLKIEINKKINFEILKDLENEIAKNNPLACYIMGLYYYNNNTLDGYIHFINLAKSNTTNINLSKYLDEQLKKIEI